MEGSRLACCDLRLLRSAETADSELQQQADYQHINGVAEHNAVREVGDMNKSTREQWPESARQQKDSRCGLVVEQDKSTRAADEQKGNEHCFPQGPRP